MPMPERDGFSLKRHLAPSFCLSMISAQTPSAFAKFYISCCRAAAARCLLRSAKRLRIGKGEDADVADLPGRRGARPISVGD
jgi:hypothetical protein